MINSADVSGATFPGRDKAQITIIPFSLATLLSTPPGLEAKSIITTSSFNNSNLSLSKIWNGIVFITISN